MPRPPARPAARLSVEVLEPREVPAFGLDTTFAAGGVAADPFAGTRFYSLADAAAAPNGAVVTAGSFVGTGYGYGGDVFVARSTTAGKADTTFGGGDGVATLAFATPHFVSSVAVQSNGKILIAGQSSDPYDLTKPADPFVLRLNADGTRDGGFGTGGEVVLDFGDNDYVSALAIQSDGKIVLAGSSATTPTPIPAEAGRPVLARLTASGTYDTSFGTGGKVVGEPGSAPRGAAGVAFRPNGKIVVAGTVVVPATYGSQATELAVAQYTTGGVLDSTFGTGGVAATNYGDMYYAYPSSLAVLDDGRVVVGGFSSYGQGLLAWFDPAGPVAGQERWGGNGPGLRGINDVVPVPGGGVRVLGSGDFDGTSGGYTVEYHPAPGAATGAITVNPGGYLYSSRAVLGSDGKLSVVSMLGSDWNVEPYAVGFPLGVARFADPGATSSTATAVRWSTPRTTTGTDPVALSADVVPLIGSERLTQGTVTFKEGATVLGSIDLAGEAGLQPWEPLPSVLVPLSPGAHTLTAEFSGSPGRAASKATQTVVVDYTAEVRAALTVSDPDPVFGGGRQLQASLTRTDGVYPMMGGAVTFYAGDTVVGESWPLLGGDAYFVLPADALPAGTYQFRAVYSGEPGFSPAESPPITVTIGGTKAATETVLAATATTPVVGAPFALTATVRAGGAPVAAGGTVTFSDGSGVLGTAPVGAGGVATLTTPLNLGTRTLRASYSGTPSALASDAKPVSVVVGRAPTATVLTASTQQFTPGQAVTLTATVRTTAGAAAPIGSVEFRDGTKVLGTAKLDGNGKAKLTTTALGSGVRSVTAVYAGCSTCDASTSAAVTLTTGRISTTTALTASALAPVYGQPQTLTARVTGAASGRVDFFDGQTLVGSASVNGSGVASVTVASNLGARKYRAVFAGAGAADGSTSAWVPVTVAKATPTVTLSIRADGAIKATVRAPYAGLPVGTVTFKADGVVLGTAAVNGNGAAVFFPAGKLAPGKYRVTAVYGGGSCFLGATSDPFDVTA